MEEAITRTVQFGDAIPEVRCQRVCGRKLCAISTGMVAPQDCERCYQQEIAEGKLRCSACGQVWPIIGGVPRFLPKQLATDIKKTQATFSFEWKMFRFSERNWGQDITFRTNLFLDALKVPPHELEGKLIFDAGCGSGALSIAMAKQFGMEIVAMDLAYGIEKAYEHNDSPNVLFVQGSVLEPPLRGDVFDYVYCAGVLVHCPDSKEAFKAVVPTLKRGGRCFVWVYHPISAAYYPADWRKLATHSWIRRNITSRLPIQIQYLLYLTLMPAFLAKQAVECMLGMKESAVTWREKMQNLFDSFSPIYQNRHEPKEVEEWYSERGFSNVEVAYREHEGFGMRGDLVELR